MYTYEEVKTFIEEEDVKFIRLAFCDLSGQQKNISINPSELDKATRCGIPFDASAIDGFGDAVGRDLFLKPDLTTLSVLPWRPATGRVVRMFCDIYEADGKPFDRDCRAILKQAILRAKEAGVHCRFGTQTEFYLFLTDENGAATKVPFDNAGYMDIAPQDKGENVRREICFTLQNMGIPYESSHHEEGPGQNEIDFAASDPLRAADNAVTFQSVVKTMARRDGLWADFSPLPLENAPGSGMHIHIALENHREAFMAGVLQHIREITYFLNPTEDSYKRLGRHKAPGMISWGAQSREALLRIPAADEQGFEVRSPDAGANVYLAFALLISAGVDGVQNGRSLPDHDHHTSGKVQNLPKSLKEAKACARQSEFVKSVLPTSFFEN